MAPEAHSAVMARLTLSAVGRLADDPGCWREPIVHRALLVSGLSVLISALTIVERQSV
jgi:hypothetical protein